MNVSEGAFVSYAVNTPVTVSVYGFAVPGYVLSEENAAGMTRVETDIDFAHNHNVPSADFFHAHEISEREIDVPSSLLEEDFILARYTRVTLETLMTISQATPENGFFTAASTDMVYAGYARWGNGGRGVYPTAKLTALLDSYFMIVNAEVEQIAA